MPVIFFIFSKDACMHYAKYASSHDYTTKVEKSHILSFFNTCINRLEPENLNLPQINSLKYCLERGIAVHHGGILPILREIVEILFQKSLIKVLFATETFSIGVNMPARTVVFISLNKPCETGRRDLYPSEYIQMAGRAGRRGQDESGTVIILSSNESDILLIENILNGQPFIVKSKFCLTYGMILRMLSKKSGSIIKVEDLMRSSFSEFGGEAKSNFVESSKAKIEDFELEIEENEKLINECKDCKNDLKTFMYFYKDLIEYQTEALSMLLCNISVSKEILETGRICLIKLSLNKYTFGIVSEEYENYKFLYNQNQARYIPMLVFIGDLINFKYLSLLKIIDHPVHSSIDLDDFLYYLNDSFVYTKLKSGETKFRAYLLKVHYSNIMFIANEKLKINWKFLKEPGINDNKETQQKKSHSFQNALKVLISFAEDIISCSIMNVLSPLNIEKYAKEFNDTYTILHYNELIVDLWKLNDTKVYECLKCSKFLKHVNIF